MSEAPIQTQPFAETPTQVERLRVLLDEFPVYTDAAVIMAPGMLTDQSITYRAGDLGKEVAWATEAITQAPDFETFLVDAIGKVTDKLPGNAEKWVKDFVGKNRDETSTIQDVAEAGAANCFVRSVAFAGLLQQLGIDAKAMQGVWVESDRDLVVGYVPPSVIPIEDKRYIYGGPNVQLLPGETGDFHAFVLVRHEGKKYLADPALWVKHEDGSPNYPLVREVTEEELLTRDIKFDLPNGRKRHYAYKGGRIFVEPKSNTQEDEDKSVVEQGVAPEEANDHQDQLTKSVKRERRLTPDNKLKPWLLQERDNLTAFQRNRRAY